VAAGRTERELQRGSAATEIGQWAEINRVTWIEAHDHESAHNNCPNKVQGEARQSHFQHFSIGATRETLYAFASNRDFD
jgi:hypothetical protein